MQGRLRDLEQCQPGLARDDLLIGAHVELDRRGLVDEPGRDAEDAQARFADQTPLITLAVDTRYEQTLEPGRYAAAITACVPARTSTS